MNTSDGLRRMGRIGVLAVGVGLLAACAAPQDTAPSGPAAAPAAPQTSLPPIVSPAQLDAGTYPTAPRPPLGTAGDPLTGAIVDAQHLADFVIGPWDADPDLITPYLSTYYLLDTATALAQFSPESVAQRAAEHRFVNGFASARQHTDRAVMINAVMRFPDAAAAAAAATDMSAAAAALPIQGAQPAPAAIPGHPEAAASSYPFTPQGSDRQWAVVRSFAPHGPYVLMQLVQSADGLEAATTLAQKAIDLQGPRVDEFTPAAADALAEVSIDPSGLLARTLPVTSETALTKNAVYSARGARHFQTDPVASKTLFTDTGVEAVAMAATNVYQARNPGSALMVVNAFSKEVLSQGPPSAPVPALPESHCAPRGKGFYCVALADRYAIEANGVDLADVHRQTAAQYILLTTG